MLCVMTVWMEGRFLHSILDQDRTKPRASSNQLPLASEVPVDKILVVYSGPTDLMDPNIKPGKISAKHKKMELYRLNFEFFLRHGIHCQTQDTLVVVTDVVKSKYQTQIDELHDKCHRNYGNYVRLISRNSTCLDMDSVRVAIEYTSQSDRPMVHTDARRTNDAKIAAYYDYFVYVNCGITGPSPLWTNRSWTSIYLRELRDGVKMTGLSINCHFPSSPHIQSMLYAMDKEGLQVVVDGGAIYDCTKRLDHLGLDFESFRQSIIWGYEIRLSELILKAGYGISSVVRPTTLFQHNVSQCLNKDDNKPLDDIWFGRPLIKCFGRIPSLDDVIFFKTSRWLTPATANLINYTLKVDWNMIE